jgi:hypothetical protein
MDALFDHICTEATLFDAWRRVERKGVQGGIDRITIDAFRQRLPNHLAQLRADLLNGRYVPEPFHKIDIPAPWRPAWCHDARPTVVERGAGATRPRRGGRKEPLFFLSVCRGSGWRTQCHAGIGALSWS